MCCDWVFFTGSKAHVEHLLGHKRFELIHHDVTFPRYVEVDAIYNLACPASPVHYQHDPVQTIKTSVHGAINMLGLAKRLGARVLQASTSEVYGDPEMCRCSEDYWGRVNPIARAVAIRASNLKSESRGFLFGLICDSPLLEVDHGQEQFIGFTGSDYRGD